MTMQVASLLQDPTPTPNPNPNPNPNQVASLLQDLCSKQTLDGATQQWLLVRPSPSPSPN